MPISPEIPPKDGSSPIGTLPAEALLHVFKFVNPIDKYTSVSRVSKFFQQVVAMEKEKYEKLCLEIFGEKYINKINTNVVSYEQCYQTINELIESYNSSEFEELIQRYEKLEALAYWKRLLNIPSEEFQVWKYYRSKELQVERVFLGEKNSDSVLHMALMRIGFSSHDCNQFLALLIIRRFMDSELSKNYDRQYICATLCAAYNYIDGLECAIDHGKDKFFYSDYLECAEIAIRNQCDDALQLSLKHLISLKHLTGYANANQDEIFAELIKAYFESKFDSKSAGSKKIFAIIAKAYPEKCIELFMEKKEPRIASLMGRSESIENDLEGDDDLCMNLFRAVPTLLEHQQEEIARLKQEINHLKRAAKSSEEVQGVQAQDNQEPQPSESKKLKLIL